MSAFRTMADRPETKLLGLRGLFIEAQRRNDVAAARGFAEEAAKAAPSLAWAGQAAFDFHCADGNWPGALEALERNSRGGLVDKDTYRRQRAVLLAARALSLENTDRAAASELAQEAVKLCPGLIPAAALAGRLLAAAGDRRKAGRILEAAWREAPHPDIADAYGDLVPGASARERLSRIRILSHLAENHLEGRLAVARAALDAHEFAEARANLKPLLSAPTRRVATLMAQLEEAETGDIGRSRQWMARAVHAGLDPVWTADGLIAENWMPVSPASGRLDAFQWRVPVADLTPRGPLLEPAPTAPAIAAPVIPEVMPVTKEIKPEIRVETEAGAQAGTKAGDQTRGQAGDQNRNDVEAGTRVARFVARAATRDHEPSRHCPNSSPGRSRPGARSGGTESEARRQWRARPAVLVLARRSGVIFFAFGPDAGQAKAGRTRRIWRSVMACE